LASSPTIGAVYSHPRYESLDAVRGIAAFIVVIYHCLLTLPVWSDVALHQVYRTKLAAVGASLPFSLLWDGPAAVYVFFALSGFVLGLMFVRPDPPGYPAFVTKRICRIYLPYIAVIAVAILLMTLTGPRATPELSEWLHTSWNQPVTWPMIWNHALMFGNLGIVDNPIWSLAVEMHYSLAFPLIMIVVIGANRLVTAELLLLSAVPILLPADILAIPGVNDLPFAFPFVAGAVLAKYRVPVTEWFQRLPSPSRIALGVLSLACLDPAGSQSQLWLPRVLAAARLDLGSILLLAGVIGSAKVHTVLAKKPLLWLGRVSYSLYLSHVVLLLTLISLLHGILPIKWILLATPPLALLLADLLYRVLERPAIALGYTLAQRSLKKGR
jgi:peptidoglycan/LPS O-acetylase OafA/YrhL